MKQIELFAGVGAFSLSAQKVGIETVLSCEIDKYACQVLRKHFKKTEIFNDDVRKLKGRDIVARHGKIDIITSGVPCQSWSIAGKREGFDDDRGTLWEELGRLIGEIKPKYFIAENVAGILSHDKGKSFEIILENLCSYGYAIDFDLLNSKDFGVAQNRNRVYILGIRLDLLNEDQIF